MEGERREKQESHVRLPPKHVHQGWSEGLGYEATKIPREARMLRAAEANKTRGQREENCRRVV
jgi:hypothetical protein